MLNINLNLPTLPTSDQKDAMDNANAPDGTNVFITANDLTIPTLQEVTDSGNTTTNDIQFDSGAGILLDNTSRLREGTIDAGLGGTKGIAQICAVGYELKWEAGRLYVMDGNGLLIRHSLHNFTTVPSANDDDTKGYYVGSLWTLDSGVSYICTDSTSTAATWSLYDANPQVNSDWNAVSGVEEILNKPTIPTKTSDLTNDGDDGNPFISLQDLPSNIVLYPTTVASDIGGYFKMVQSITDPNYNTVAVDVSTGAISGTAQLISSLATSANVIVGNPGVFDITTIGNIRKVSGTGEAEFFFRVYKRNLAGTETLIIQSNNTLPVTNGGYAEFSATGLWNDGLFISTDRIVIKYYANRIAGGSNPTYEFQFGGSLPVRTLVPIPLTVVPFITLDEVADVTISGVANNDLLAYDNATSLWKNKTASTLGLVETTDSRLTDTRIRKVSVYDNVDSTVTGTTVETVLKTLLIPTLGANTTLKIMSQCGKVGAAATAIFKMYYNTTPDLSGSPVQIALLNFTAVQSFSPFNRDITNKNSVSLNSMYPATASAAVDALVTFVRTNLDIDLSGKYIVFTGKLTSAADTSRFDNARLLIEE